MSLAHLEYQALFQSVTKQKSMYEAGINPGHADRTSTAYGGIPNSPLAFSGEKMGDQLIDAGRRAYLITGAPGGILEASSGLILPSRSMSAASLFARFNLSLTGLVPVIILESG